MSSKALQRGIVIAMILATVGGALAAYLVSHSQLNSRRSHQASNARLAISDAVQRRAFYLKDVADMVGVHDGADRADFSRYAHARGKNEDAVVSVQWVRRSPSGRLLPPRDAGPAPVLVSPAETGNKTLADAAANTTAAPVVKSAELDDRVALSAPVALADGNSGFYFAVPVVSDRFSGEASDRQLESAVVGLIDAQRLVADALPSGQATDLQLRDQVTPLATLGSDLDDTVQTAISTPARHWTLTVDGGSLTPAEQALPWLILLIGGALTFTVAVVLRTLARRRDAALALASERSAELAATLERVEQTNRELEQARSEAVRLSREDPVTGIFNRRHFGEVLARELSHPEGDIPAVLLLDLDHFKRVNDEHGHLMGDAVLQAVTDRIASVLRDEDCLARWGGEEFAVLAPSIDREGAHTLAERAREALAEAPVRVGEVSIALTLSVGGALAAEGQRTPEALVHAADQALYEAKGAGRNCVRVSDEGAQPSAVSAR